MYSVHCQGLFMNKLELESSLSHAPGSAATLCPLLCTKHPPPPDLGGHICHSTADAVQWVLAL